MRRASGRGRGLPESNLCCNTCKLYWIRAIDVKRTTQTLLYHFDDLKGIGHENQNSRYFYYTIFG